MTALVEYVIQATDRGECRCGDCIDGNPDATDRLHTINMEFFDVKIVGEPDPDTLRTLVEEHVGAYGEVDPFDGKEHNYIELGGWIGDQGLAMQLMALGYALDMWELLTPSRLLGDTIPQELKMQMAGQGLIAIQCGGDTNEAR